MKCVGGLDSFISMISITKIIRMGKMHAEKVQAVIKMSKHQLKPVQSILTST